MDACTNPDILRVIWFFLMLIDIVKIIIPIALIVLGIIEFSKAAISSDENAQKKSGQLFIKRLIYAILIFTLPWLIEVLIVTLGNLEVLKKDETNFTDCLENATGEKIEELESNGCGGKRYVINYYKEDGITLYKTDIACNGETYTFDSGDGLSKAGYRMYWKPTKIYSGVNRFNPGSNFTFNKQSHNESSFNVILTYEKIQ